MKLLYLSIAITLVILNLNFIHCYVQVELKKSMAKFHHEYLKNLKFLQVNRFGRKFSSFLEEKNYKKQA